VYSEFFNQFINIGKYFISLALIYILFPIIVFNKNDNSITEKLYINFFKAALLVIILGYILVITKLFEIISIILIIVLLSLRKGRNFYSRIEDYFEYIKIKVFDFFEKREKTKVRIIIGEKLSRSNSMEKNSITKRFEKILFFISFITIIGYSTYIRFTEALTHAAPSMSDAFSVLAWVKNINDRVLFYNGGGEIYPRGFHISMAFIKKFAFIDYMYVLNYTGPLCSVMIVIGLYFAVSRFTKNKGAGLIAAFIYGVLGQHILLGDFERQVATNSQEFALLFVFPTIYFFHSYYKTRDKEYFIAGACGLLICAFVHLIPFALIVMSVCIIGLFFVFEGIKENIKNISYLLLTGLISLLAIAFPYIVGKLMGANVLSTSSEYLTSQIANITFKQLTIFDIITVISLIIIFVYSLVADKKFTFLSSEKYIFLIGLATFVIYYFGPVITKNEVLQTRAIQIWALVIPVCIGACWNIIYKYVVRIPVIQYVLIIFLVISILFNGTYYKGYYKPISPYKMVYDSMVEAHLKIYDSFRPTEWITVNSGEGAYALALGSGFNISMEDFIELCFPYKSSINETNEIANNIFIFYHKKVFRTNHENLQDAYDKLEVDNANLLEWLNEYKKNNGDIDVFYEDDNLVVYLIKKDVSKEEKTKLVWE
jgi:hypothetical protein